MPAQIQGFNRSMKKIVEQMKKDNDAVPGDQYHLARDGDTIQDEITKLLPELDPKVKRRITSGDDLLDQAFNIALNKKFKKK